ncbi:FAD:protein FMN transferase [Undibacterium terreum]|uniref:FAD:protein FMN transferase n=1 Tax=Undibacterium terreum TaxID=1224302 RepID=A0A916V2A1_9BURK|nr:FAD:protein FMN transferase [Undibacterium terreum]GGD00420.1 FAD:protein FMN transferase [Undibacterium terreum]
MVEPVFRIAFEAMASRCEIRLAAPDETAAGRLAQAAVDEVRRIEHKYSRYRPDSIVSRINAAAGKEAVECDEETSALLAYADCMYKASHGLFDITSGVLRRAWNFRAAALPEPEKLAPLLDLIGWAKVHRDLRRICLPRAGMELDFGGFGKEYAADRAAAVLEEQGVQFGYANLGGDIRVIGPQPDGQAWDIGIQDPRHADRIIATIPVSRGALATSGDYERFFELDGRRYCHILNPRCGMPVSHWRSVSVLGPLAIAAGSCSTIAMLKQKDALVFLDSSGMSYLAIDQQGNLLKKNA